MIRSLWIAKTGLDAQQTQLDVSLAQPRQRQHQRLQALARRVRGPDLPEHAPARRAVVAADAAAYRAAARHRRAAGRDRAHLHAGQPAADQQPSTSRSTATASSSCRLPDGTTAYTRDGSFHVDRAGPARHRQRHPVAARRSRSRERASRSPSARDGMVSARVSGQSAPTQVGQIQLATFINPAGLEPHGQNLYVETGRLGHPQRRTRRARTAPGC